MKSNQTGENKYLIILNSLNETTRLKLQTELRDQFLKILGLENEFKLWLNANFDNIMKQIIEKLEESVG